MASSGIRRKVDDLGRVVIPASVRRSLGIREGDPVEVTVEGERVVIARPREACVFCGREDEDLTTFRGRLVCRLCLAGLGEVDERLRTTAAADAKPASAPTADARPRAATAGGEESAPLAAPAARSGDRRPVRGGGPAEAPAATPAHDRVPEPASGPERVPRPGRAPTPDGEEPVPRGEQRPRPPRRPPYDPSSTTAW